MRKWTVGYDRIHKSKALYNGGVKILFDEIDYRNGEYHVMKNEQKIAVLSGDEVIQHI